MQYTSFDLGRQERGAVVEVSLTGSAANVRLLDSSNFSSYKAGRNHRYHGGHVTRSPVQLQIPNSGRWYVAIDYGGHAGRGRATVRVLPGTLPPLRTQSAPSLSTIAQHTAPSDGRQTTAIDWDVFICHATEDKDDLVRPLASALRELGLRVWYDEFELRIGDSLRRSIDTGLARSQFGIVVLSQPFFSKNWTQYELDGLVTREMTGEQIILPLWHMITKAEVIGYSPSLADKVARNTADMTIDEIADEIASVVLPPDD